jgi:hypothetical protein
MKKPLKWRKEKQVNKLRESIVNTLQQLGEKTGNYQTPWTVTYKILQQQTKCRFKARLRHIRKRKLSEGISKSEVDKLNILDVMDRPMMQLYWYIVQEYANKNKGGQA